MIVLLVVIVIIVKVVKVTLVIVQGVLKLQQSGHTTFRVNVNVKFVDIGLLQQQS